MKIQHLRNGVILICVGLVFLFNNLGYLDWEVWETILSWWPIYLIAIGIEIVFRNSRLKPLALISPLVFAFFILGPAWWQWNGEPEHEELVQESHWSQPVSLQTEVLKARLDFNLGRLTFSHTSEPKVICNFKSKEDLPDVTYSQDNKTATLNINDRGRKVWGFSFRSDGVSRAGFGGRDSRDWKVAVDSSKIIELNLGSNLSKNNLDLTRLKLKRLDLDLCLGRADIRLGDRSDTVWVEIEQELSKVVLWIPKSSAVVLDQDTHLGGSSSSDVKVLSREDESSQPKVTGKPLVYLTHTGSLSSLRLNGY